MKKYIFSLLLLFCLTFSVSANPDKKETKSYKILKVVKNKRSCTVTMGVYVPAIGQFTTMTATAATCGEAVRQITAVM